MVKLNSINVNNVYKRYRKSKGYAINGITLSIDKPGIYSVVGPNGAGKTTLLKLISRLIKITSGTIKTEGLTFYLPELPAYYGNLTALDHYNFIKNIVNQNNLLYKPEEILNMINLDKNKPVKNYSKGMKRRLNIGMALMVKSDIILLDEPFDGLDPSISEQLSNIIKKMNDGNNIIIISSHDLSRVEDISDTIIFMKSGRILKEIHNIKNNEITLILSTDENNISKISDTGIPFNLIGDKIVINTLKKDLPYTVNKLNHMGIQIYLTKIFNV